MDILLHNDSTFFFEKTISKNSSDYLQRVLRVLIAKGVSLKFCSIFQDTKFV